ncbi:MULTISPECIES: helix-turn-helix transcriptional regulator [unclassified Pseudomonas]|uniref:helix-turn-helix transcriptional regulator n=1 Tax=unclassified Pseudomonas TaxID=196821 RepID=UPI002447628E|nr:MULTISPECIES: helix-turn-helix transcriptional regulator [unclassified Pseudomonas]MDG9922411.1 helix-turn-helix domain-containing protein [Pseudomonas sp. GD04045]MDH0034391.1 helix-turn-helix domain-containing protein [Pseudomonas sp. GD04019]
MLNQALRLIRSYHDLSQTELAEELSVSNSHLSEIESGKKQPSLELLNKYSERFDVPLSSILFFSENLDSTKPLDGFRSSVARKIINIMEWVGNKNEAKASRKLQKNL